VPTKFSVVRFLQVCLATVATLFLTLSPPPARAQAGEWAWQGGGPGSNTGVPIYGTKGVPSTQNLPALRYGSGTWADSKGNLWLFGGYGDDPVYTQGYLNDLWVYSIANKTWEWVNGSSLNGPDYGQGGVYGTLGVASTGNMPGGRFVPAIWQDSGGNVWMFGGSGRDSSNSISGVGSLNDLWMYNPTTNEWAWMAGSTTVPGFEQGRAGIYGTLGVANSANLPGGRYGAATWTDAQGNFWLFGGAGADGSGNSGDLNDLWMFNSTTQQWTWEGGSQTANNTGVYSAQGVPSTSNLPSAREGAFAWADAKGNFWLFSGATIMNDLWEFNPSTKQWTWLSGNATGGATGSYGTVGVSSASNLPPGRSYGSAWSDASGNLWLYGGEGVGTPDDGRLRGYDGTLSDEWMYSPQINQWIWVAGSNGLGAGANYGTEGTPNAANIPGNRHQQDYWKDGQGNFWLYGGSYLNLDQTTIEYDKIQFYSDLWEFGAPAVSSSSAPAATISPAGLQFTTVVGQTSGAQTVTLQNSGSVSLSISGITFTGTGADDYQQTNTCGGSVAPGASCAISVTFAPATVAAFPAALSVADNAPGSPQLVVLAGTGTVPTATAIGANASSTTVGSTVTIVATVTSTIGSTIPTGAVTFSEDGTTLGMAAVNGSGVATYTSPALTLGSHSFTAVYGGDSSHAGSSSGSTSVSAIAATQTSAPQWEWVAGSQNAHNQGLGSPGVPVFGTQGTPSAANYPGDLYGVPTWADTHGNLWLFDSYNGLNTLWKYSIASGQWTWVTGNGSLTAGTSKPTFGTQGVAATGNTPGFLSGAVSWTDSSGYFWLFGGQGPDVNFTIGPSNILWMFNPSTSQWTWVSGSNSLGSYPGGLPGVYGTKGTASSTNMPGGRYTAQAWTDKSGNFWMFGGVGADSTGQQNYLNDLWMFNVSSKQWTWVSGSNLADQDSVYGNQGVASAANVPGARVDAATWVDQSGNLWLFGGGGFAQANSTGFLNDLWKFNIASSQWTWVGGSNVVGAAGVYGTEGTSSSANVPGGRQSAAAWTDSSGNFWLMGGGNQLDPNTFQITAYFNDLWVYSSSANAWTWVAGSNTANPVGTYGTEGTPSASNIPSGRDGAATWTDSSGNFWLMGGESYPYVQLSFGYELSIYDDLWTTASVSSTPPTGPQATLTQSALSFTSNAGQISAQQSVTLSNGGSSTLNISGITLAGTGSSAFNQTTTCGSTLAAGSTCSISVTFTPAAATSYSATVSVADNASTSPQTVTLNGTGTAASAPGVTLTPSTPLSFTSTVATASAAQSITITNNGTASLSITGITLGGNGTSAFGETNTCGVSLAVNANCAVSVIFTPASATTYSATLSIADNASGSPQTVNLSGSGTASPAPAVTLTPNAPLSFSSTVSTASAAQSVMITNSGTASLSITKITLGGSGTGAFGETNTCGSTLAANTSCSVSVIFTPASATGYSATLSISDNASNSPQTLALSGTGTAVATTTALGVSGASITAGTSETLTATVKETGGAATPTGTVTFYDGSTSLGTGSLNGSGIATYMTSSLASGPHSLTAGYAGDTNNKASTSAATAVTVTAIPTPTASLTPNGPLAFSATTSTTSAAQTITLTNSGTAALSITSIGVAGTNASSFAETNTCGTSLAAGANCAISITFSPASAASFSAALNVTDNANGSPQAVTLNGTGTAVPTPTFAISALAGSGTVSATTPATYTLTVTPQNGSFTSLISLTATGVPAGYTATFTPASLTPGSTAASATLTIAKSASAMLRTLLPITAPMLGCLAFFWVPGKRRRRSLALLLFLAASLGTLIVAGCGGGFVSPRSAYTITVTASGGGVTQTTTVPLTVQQ
jgi:N-acetylneuraminic acid mutarotase